MANQVRLLLFMLAYHLGNFLRRLALPRVIKDWSLRSLPVRLIKIGARTVRHARRIIFQMAEVAVSRDVFATFRLIAICACQNELKKRKRATESSATVPIDGVDDENYIYGVLARQVWNPLLADMRNSGSRAMLPKQRSLTTAEALATGVLERV